MFERFYTGSADEIKSNQQNPDLFLHSCLQFAVIDLG